MPQKPVTQVRSVNSQASRRWVETVYDQHKSARFPKGRPFWGYVEIPSDPMQAPSFVTELVPGDHNDPMNSSWSAPWVPEQRTTTQGGGARSYYRLDMRKLTLTWLYPAIIADDSQALEAYYDDAAQKAYEKGWPAPAYGDPIGPQLRAVCGPPPRSPKIAEAALAGDPWILGHTDQVNPELQELLKNIRRPQPVAPPVAPCTPVDLEARIAEAVAAALATAKPKGNEYQEFFASCRESGMSVPEIGKAWQEHKKLVEA